MLSIVWKESLKWLGIYTAFVEGGFDHFKTFKGLVAGGKKAKEMLGVVWIVSRSHVVCAAFVSSIAVAVVSHNAMSRSLGSEACFASRARDLLLALARDPIAAPSWLKSGALSFQVACKWALQYLFGCFACSVQIY
ncbi:hypothetical protein A2U01_0029740, partial [Trifolium medium]|nr:hypothetical protein [Trifolium medium]